MSEAGKMADLIARLEAAERGSRELDGEMFKALVGPLFDATPDPFGMNPCAIWGGAHGPRSIPAFTTSLDAIAALTAEKLPDVRISVDQFGAGFTVRFHRIGRAGYWVKANAATEPLARCIALLRALERVER